MVQRFAAYRRPTFALKHKGGSEGWKGEAFEMLTEKE